MGNVFWKEEFEEKDVEIDDSAWGCWNTQTPPQNSYKTCRQRRSGKYICKEHLKKSKHKPHCILMGFLVISVTLEFYKLDLHSILVYSAVTFSVFSCCSRGQGREFDTNTG